MNYIDQYDPDYVVVPVRRPYLQNGLLKMVAYHKEKEAACTIAIIDVPLAESFPVRHFEHQAGRLDLRI